MSRSERAVTVLLAAVFAAAGVLKILDPLSFATLIAKLRLLPMTAVGAVAIVLPWIELVAAAALFVPAYRGPSLRLILGLLLAFTPPLVFGLASGKITSCGCFGSGDGFLNRADVAVARNLILLALAAILLRRKPTSPAGPASPA